MTDDDCMDVIIPTYRSMSNRELAGTLREIGEDFGPYQKELGDQVALDEAARRLNGGKRHGRRS